MLIKYLQEDLFVNKKFKNKNEALKYFAELLEKNKYVKSAKDTLNAALEREKQFPTNIGSKIGMPHILNDVVLKPCILFAKVNGLVWDENDKTENGKVDYIFFLNYNKSTGESSHMETIQELSSLLIDDNFIASLKNISSTKELKALINKKTNTKKDEVKSSNALYEVVAVTACPTGVAHTFLAKDALEKKAKEMNVSIKVETQGTEGARNVLTDDEIKNAKGVILALDRSIDTSKFAGKENIVEISTREAIKNPENNIKKVLENKGVKFEGNKSSNANKFEDTDLISFKNFGKRTYRSLMNGVGHMLPFVIFGGILIAIAFMIDSFSGVPENASNQLGSYTETAKWFKQIGDIAFSMLVPILCAYMAFGLVGKGGLLPGFVCGLMATGKMTQTVLVDGVPTNVPWLMGWLDPQYIKMLSSGSGFFGAIGGAMLTACMFILISKYVLAKFPKSLNAISNILFMPLFGTLIIATLFFFINIPLQFVNLGFGLFLNLFAKRPELYPLLGIVMGLMMCADLGGPINKAAYVFGTITLASATKDGSIPMAIAMGAGMVPPLAIALSGTFDKKIWTDTQRKESYVNYVMGISFISEGAIPYTAAQPKKMIISNLVGGAVTGILIASLQVGSLAPHGGIFVAPLLRTQLAFANTEALKIGLGITFFLVSVLVGAIIEMVVIGVLSRFTKFGKNKELEQVNA